MIEKSFKDEVDISFKDEGTIVSVFFNSELAKEIAKTDIPLEPDKNYLFGDNPLFRVDLPYKSKSTLIKLIEIIETEREITLTFNEV